MASGLSRYHQTFSVDGQDSGIVPLNMLGAARQHSTTCFCLCLDGSRFTV